MDDKKKTLFSEGLNDFSKIYHKSVGQNYNRPKKSRKELKKLFGKKAKLVKNARAFIKRAKSKKKREEDRESYASLLKKSLLKTLGY